MEGRLWSIAKWVLLAGAVFFVFGRTLFTRTGPESSKPAPPFELVQVDDSPRTLSLADLKGQPVVLQAIATWCGACKRTADDVAQAARAARIRPVHFVSVVLDTTVEEARALEQRWGIPSPVLIDDGRFARDYRVALLPTFVVLDAEGRVVRVHGGTADEDDIEEWLEPLGAARLQ